MSLGTGALELDPTPLAIDAISSIFEQLYIFGRQINNVLPERANIVNELDAISSSTLILHKKFETEPYYSVFRTYGTRSFKDMLEGKFDRIFHDFLFNDLLDNVQYGALGENGSDRVFDDVADYYAEPSRRYMRILINIPARIPMGAVTRRLHTLVGDSRVSNELLYQIERYVNTKTITRGWENLIALDTFRPLLFNREYDEAESVPDRSEDELSDDVIDHATRANLQLRELLASVHIVINKIKELLSQLTGPTSTVATQGFAGLTHDEMIDSAQAANRLLSRNFPGTFNFTDAEGVLLDLRLIDNDESLVLSYDLLANIYRRAVLPILKEYSDDLKDVLSDNRTRRVTMKNAFNRALAEHIAQSLEFTQQLND